MMTLKLEVERDTPLAVADALIQREWALAKEDYGLIIARENIRLMGQALINQAEASDRASKAVQELY